MINDGNSFLVLCFNLTYQDIVVFCYVSVQQQVSVLNILFQTLKAIFSIWCFSLWRGKNNVHYCETHKLYQNLRMLMKTPPPAVIFRSPKKPKFGDRNKLCISLDVFYILLNF